MKLKKEPEISSVTEIVTYGGGRRAVRIKDQNSGIFIEKMLDGRTPVRGQTQNMLGELRRSVIDEMRMGDRRESLDTGESKNTQG